MAPSHTGGRFLLDALPVHGDEDLDAVPGPDHPAKVGGPHAVLAPARVVGPSHGALQHRSRDRSLAPPEAGALRSRLAEWPEPRSFGVLHRHAAQRFQSHGARSVRRSPTGPGCLPRLAEHPITRIAGTPRDDAPPSERTGPIPPSPFQAPTATASTGQDAIPAMRWDGFEAYLLDQVKAAVTAADRQGRITHWNRHAESLFGWNAGEAMGRDLGALLLGPDPSPAPRNLEAALRGEASWEGELPVTGKDGAQLLCYWSLSPIRAADGTPSGVVGIGVDVTERARKDRLVAARTAVTRALGEAADLDAATPPILRAVCEHLDWEVGALWRVDESAGVLRCLDVWHQSSREAVAFEELTRRTTFPPGVGLPGRVWKSDRPAWISEVTQDDNLPRAPAAAAEGLHGAFGFPIRLGRTVLGVLEFFSREIREPDDLLRSTMSVIGSQ